MKPLVAVIGDRTETGDLTEGGELPAFAVGEKYARAVHDFAGCLPMLALPVLTSDDLDDLLARCDGVFFTGSPSNVHPRHWKGPADTPGPFDEMRDDFALELTRRVVAQRVPALFICRGFQEMNVALGGTLLPEITRVEGRMRHHAPEQAPLDQRYGPLHEVTLRDGSPLEQIFGARRFMVNSLHYQGLDQIAPALRLEARADDGTPEAVMLPDHPFAVGVQWHPEFRPDLYPLHARLLAAFGDAARQHAQARNSCAA
ncbi:MAG: gamma-glutamyl-gamma-aminobutyrate hydrolase family protein [Xanthobacter sp.]